MLWIPVTIAASLAQLARNALQSGLTASVGTLGATMVRFLYALPFTLAAYCVAIGLLGQDMPGFSAPLLGWAVLGALGQISATALMLKAMEMGGFAIAYAYIKTEPVLLALGGWWLLGDVLPLQAWVGIVLATAGVMWAALPSGSGLAAMRGHAGAMALGVAGGALFGLSSIAYRAAILTLDGVVPPMAALHVMVFVLCLQTVLMGAWLWLTDRAALRAVFRAWRPSMAAGFSGALGTLFWFIAYALTPVANVRTLALVEMPLAALMNNRVSGKKVRSREWAGIALVGIGIVLLVRAAAG